MDLSQYRGTLETGADSCWSPSKPKPKNIPSKNATPISSGHPDLLGLATCVVKKGEVPSAPPFFMPQKNSTCQESSRKFQGQHACRGENRDPATSPQILTFSQPKRGRGGGGCALPTSEKKNRCLLVVSTNRHQKIKTTSAEVKRHISM